jgi:hypothetical protein
MCEQTHTRRVELLLLDIAKVFEELLPTLAEEERGIAAAPTVLDPVNIHGFVVLAHCVAK